MAETVTPIRPLAPKKDRTAAERQRRFRKKRKSVTRNAPVTPAIAHPTPSPQAGEGGRSVTIATTVAALALATVSAGFSITGMTAVFVGATVPVIAMGVALELGKLSAVAWLGRYSGGRALRAGLIVLVAVLMGLNAIGAYGFLAKAHIGHAVAGETAVAGRSAEVEARITVQAGVVADIDRRIGQIDAAIDKGDQQGPDRLRDGARRPAAQDPHRSGCPAHQRGQDARRPSSRQGQHRGRAPEGRCRPWAGPISRNAARNGRPGRAALVHPGGGAVARPGRGAALARRRGLGAEGVTMSSLKTLRTKQRNWYDPRTYRAGRRTFSAEVKRLAWKRCNKQCQQCTRHVTGAGDIEFDHIIPWEISRDSSLGNCQVLCTDCHEEKTAAEDVPAIAAADRKADFHLGIRGPGRGKSPLPGGRYERDGSPGRFSKTISNGVVPRISQAEQHRRFIARRYEFRDDPE